MADTETRPYYVLTLQGQLGPFDKQGLKDLVLAGGARPEDQVRTAFGRPLGTVREVVGHIRQTGSGRVVADPAPSASGRRPAATGSAAGRSPATASAAGRHRPHASGRAAATTSGRSARGSGRGAPPPARRPGSWLWPVLVAALLAIAGLVAALLGRG